MQQPKLYGAEICFLCNAFLFIYIYLQIFLLIPVLVSELRSEHTLKLNFKNEQQTITINQGNAELRLLCTAHLLNEMYLPTHHKK